MHHLLTYSLAGFCLIASSLHADEAEESVEKKIRSLIPTSTAIDREVFEKIATASTSPTEMSFNELSLSAALFTLKYETAQKSEGQFTWLTDRLPKPSQVAREMYHSLAGGRILTKPITMIQAERITELDIKINGDQMSGSFAFHVPELYEGKADFVATKNDNTWRIMQFHMPGIDVHIQRNDKGLWRRVETE